MESENIKTKRIELYTLATIIAQAVRQGTYMTSQILFNNSINVLGRQFVQRTLLPTVICLETPSSSSSSVTLSRTTMSSAFSLSDLGLVAPVVVAALWSGAERQRAPLSASYLRRFAESERTWKRRRLNASETGIQAQKKHQVSKNE